KSAHLVPKEFVPNSDLVLSRRNVVNLILSVQIRHCEVWIVGEKNVPKHPGMNFTGELHGSQPRFSDLALDRPTRVQADVNLCRKGFDCVQDRVCASDLQLSVELHHKYMRDEAALRVG